MTNFWKNAGRGYMMIVEPFNGFWSYLFSREWRHSTEDTLYALALMVIIIPLTLCAYLCVAPIAAILMGMREEEA